MPKEMHEALQKEAKKKFGTTKSERARAYIWGTIQKAEMMMKKGAKKKMMKH